MDGIPPELLLDRMAAQANKWADSLIDLGSRNTLLYFKDTKSGTLDLTGAPEAALGAVHNGQKIRFGSLFPEVEAHREACLRARSLRRKIVELDEEQGVEAGRLALGLLRVAAPTTRGTSPVPPLRAPLLLRPVTISTRTISENDFSLQIDGEAEINPVLPYALGRQYGLEADIDDLTDKLNAAIEEAALPGDQVAAAYRILEHVLLANGLTPQLEERTVVGIFSFDRLPMVQDLRRSVSLLAGHQVIAALANDEAAKTGLLDRAAGYAAEHADEIEPRTEFLVLDADASQQKAISTVLAGHHLVIEGPPGTGKSQTIANIIASLAAQGRRVLFVAEKRAAIEAVTDRLAQVDLDGLVFDLHGNKLNRREIAQQLQQALERAGNELQPPRDGLHDRLGEFRAKALLHKDELHRPHEPWQLSAYEAIGRLTGRSDSHATRFRLRGSQLVALHGASVKQATDDLHRYVVLQGLVIRRGESPWARTSARTQDQIEHALDGLDKLASRTLRDTRREIESLVEAAGLRKASNVTEWRMLLGLMHGVTRTLEVFHSQVFGPGLDDLVAATGNGAYRRANNHPISWLGRRRLVKVARNLRRDGLRDRRALHSALSEAQSQAVHWQGASVGGKGPYAVPSLDRAMRDLDDLHKQLAAVALCADIVDGWEGKPADDVAETIQRLDGQRTTLQNMPEVNSCRDRLEAAGLAPLLDELAERQADPQTALDVFDFAWWSSILDEVRSRSRHLRTFTGTEHDRTVEGFRRTDKDHLTRNAARVRYKVATNLRQTRDANQDQSALVRQQAYRKIRHLPLRKLVEKAPDVLLAAKPCWAMSPLVVSRVLPAARLFDVVVFDEASQVPPYDAITSIMRARQVVVAGDPHQLPPTSFFTRVLSGTSDDEDEEEQDADLDSFESLLEMLSGSLPDSGRVRLRWHYRSADERLIAFSNHNIYQDDLVTFPGTALESPIRLEVVDGRTGPGQKGSAPEEVAKVVELVLDHAVNHPEMSLGVIAMGQSHAERIQLALSRAWVQRPELEPFFNPEAGPGRRFFVKNLERVQGDERDAIILSIGYAKQASGRLPMQFGPLNRDGGERRLNVAITRARRSMTVVASFSHEDFDPSSLHATKNSGPELLRQFLQYCSHRGELDRVGKRETAYELNGFERDVQGSLEREGITVVPQWGVSDYRIDFALTHPGRPGQMVLAVETDGDSYHRAASARDRDRLRQSHLENLGWRFHRIWASDWFRDPAAETARAVRAWQESVQAADDLRDRGAKPAREVAAAETTRPFRSIDQAEPTRGPRPRLPVGERIGDYSDADLRALFRWLLSDGLQLDRDTRVRQAMDELGFKKLGKVIEANLTRAFTAVQRQIDRETP